MSQPSLADILEPEWDLLLVRRDADERQIGVGLGGRALVAPDSATDIQPCRSGVVIKAGPQAAYQAGQRIAFGRYAMTVLEIEERDRALPRDASREGIAVGLVPSAEVLCTWEEKLERPLAVEGAATARAPYGCLLLERSEIPDGRGRILHPDGYTTSVRSMEARVLSVHPSVAGCPYRTNELVLLSSNVGRHVPFGITHERVLWVATPTQIVCHIRESLPKPIPAEDESPLRFRGPLQVPQTAQFDEGDRQAPR